MNEETRKRLNLSINEAGLVDQIYDNMVQRGILTGDPDDEGIERSELEVLAFNLKKMILEEVDPDHRLVLGMKQVFSECMIKAVDRLKVKGNTAEPWNDFPTDHLKLRLLQEIDEWNESGNSDELIDVINHACFLRISMILDSGRLTYDDFCKAFDKR